MNGASISYDIFHASPSFFNVGGNVFGPAGDGGAACMSDMVRRWRVPCTVEVEAGRGRRRESGVRRLVSRIAGLPFSRGSLRRQRRTSC